MSQTNTQPISKTDPDGVEKTNIKDESTTYSTYKKIGIVVLVLGVLLFLYLGYTYFMKNSDSDDDDNSESKSGGFNLEKCVNELKNIQKTILTNSG